MMPSQKKVIEENWTELCEKLKNSVDSFLVYLEMRNIISDQEKQLLQCNTFNEAKILDLIKLTITKDHGWDAIIEYLMSNDYKSLAYQLNNSSQQPAGSTVTVTSSTAQRDEFQEKLVAFYKAEHSCVPTMFGNHKHVTDVWVPLRIDEKTSHSQQQTTCDHIELQRRLANPLNPHVAIVKGDPGIGKTTLVKKIAFDWATGHCEYFSLILVVPLRYVGPTDNFIQLAVEYYTHRLQLPECFTTNLVSWLNGLGRKLLICLDGLDEYGSFAQSPLANLFAEKFRNSKKGSSNCQAPLFPHQLLITSRPYACDISNQSFFVLRFEISSLNKAHIKDFIGLYCETDEGKSKVSQYVAHKKDLVIAVPLILVFICYLADLSEEIPTNLSLLYEKLVYNMLKREIDEKKIPDDINNDCWKESKVVQSTAELAFDGCKRGKFEFPQSDQNSFSVSNDSFISGFLLQKFNFEKEKLNAEFPHRSIQEFFAALHCVQMIFTTETKERDSVMKEILRKDSQFGRFFFGICSDDKRFGKMLEWLNPTIEDAEILSFSPKQLLFSLSVSLSDCSEAEAKLLGQTLAASLDRLEKKIRTKTRRNSKIFVVVIEHLSSLNKSFQSGLNLNFVDENSIHPSWSSSHVDKPKWSRLTYVDGDLPANLRKKFDKIQVFMLIWDIDDPAGMISSLDRLPPVSTLIVQTRVDRFEVNFDLNYEITSAAIQLRHFTFGFDKDDIPSLKDLFSDQPETDVLIIGETRKTGEYEEISWLTVRIRRILDHRQLVKILIRFALEITVGPLEAKRRESNCGLM